MYIDTKYCGIGDAEETKISKGGSWVLVYVRDLRGDHRDHGRFPVESHIIFTRYRMSLGRACVSDAEQTIFVVNFIV